MFESKIFKSQTNNKLFNIIASSADEINQPTYLIGGFVRDILLNRNIDKNDIDIVTVGSSEKLATLVNRKLKIKNKVSIFKKFGTAMINYKSTNIEFVSSRKESYKINSRNPKVTTGSIIDDHNRRDFTINSISIQLNSNFFGNLLDPFNGIDDLKNKIIKTPLDPSITYKDDPLRILRAVRFACELGFEIDQNSMAAIKLNSKRIEIISKERIINELNKIILSETPSRGFFLLDDLEILKILFPELIELKGVEEIFGQKHKDNFNHTLEVLDNISKLTDNLWLRWAALLHDIGKSKTKKFVKKIGWTFHGHEHVGSKMVYEIFKRFKLPLNEKMRYVKKIVYLSSRPISLTEDNITDSAIRRLLYDAGNDIEDLITLCEADITTKNINKLKLYRENFKTLRIKIEEVENRDKLRNFQPPITGEHIMNYFKIKPCKEIGIIKEKIKNAILDGKIPNEFSHAKKMMILLGNDLDL